MKSKWRLVLVFFLMLVVTACNQTNTSSSNSVSYPSMSGSSTSSTQGGQTIQDWEQDDKDLMIEIVSEVIPVAPLTSNYLCISDEDEYGPYLYIYDEQSPDISEEYSDILIANGYLYDSFSEGYYFYYKEVSEESLLILQFGYYPGDSDYPASMDLFAWLEGNTSSLETITSWDQELLDMMQEVLSTPLPVASLTKQYDYMNYVDDVGDNIVYIYDL